MKKILLSLAFSALLFYSCEDDGLSPSDCAEDLVCTEELRYFTYSPTENGAPLLLDNYYVKNIDNGNIYSNSTLNISLNEGQYFLISDAWMNEIQKSGTIIRFFGVKNNQIILQTEFTIGHDCCHITAISGPVDVKED